MSNLISNLAVEHKVMISDPYIVGVFFGYENEYQPFILLGSDWRTRTCRKPGTKRISRKYTIIYNI